MNDSQPIRAVIADDERLMREQLRARLAEVWPALEIVGEARHGAEAVELVTSLRPDVAFLDIRMPGMTGVEAARAIARLDADEDWPGCEVVFITAYDQYAVEAFEQGAIDYVLKPAEPQRLAVTAERVRQRLAVRHQQGGEGTADALQTQMQRMLAQLASRVTPDTAPKRLQWIQAQVGQTIQMIPVEDVLFFISDEKYTRVQTAAVEALIRKPIKELVEELEPDLFWQIHRSTLVNAKAIAGVTRDLRGRQMVAVKGHGEKLEVSRSYTQLFKGM
ncbi:MAG TPA: LytTR family DNA-binding domain-containing protein [Methylibium sp.]|nr:LytTR family DNA-binding domain-containing protein [Methylibium sp.]